MGYEKTKAIKLKKWDDNELENFEISPDLYTHLTIVETLKAVPKGLETGNAKSGLIGLAISVDQLEQIVKARGLLKTGDEYYPAIEAKLKELKKEDLEAIMLQAKLANYKLGLLMQIVFGTTTKSVELIL